MISAAKKVLAAGGSLAQAHAAAKAAGYRSTPAGLNHMLFVDKSRPEGRSASPGVFENEITIAINKLATRKAISILENILEEIKVDEVVGT